MDTVNQMCLSTLPGYAPRGTRDRAALARLTLAERGSEDEVIVVIHKVPVGERDRDADNREGITMSWSSRRGASAATGGRPPLRAWRAWRRPVLALPAVAVVALAACSAGPGGTTAARQPGGRPPPCSANPPPVAPPLHPTTVTTIGQAYYCVFAHYYAGSVLDDRVLLAGAFAGFTHELDQLGMDQPDATMPALTGNRDRDWAAFAAVYQKVTSQLPASPAQRQELAAATMTAMIASLDNNHARWSYPAPPPGDVPGDLGILTSPAPYVAAIAPQEALPPLFITAVLPDPPPPAAGCGPETSSSRSTARRRSPTASSPTG